MNYKECPLKHGKPYEEMPPCIESECGFWDAPHGQCAVLTIATSLSRLPIKAESLIEQDGEER